MRYSFRCSDLLLPWQPVRLPKLLVLVFAALVLCSCSASAPDPADSSAEQRAAASGPQRVSIYLARGSLFQAPEFEQFKVSGSSLFVECGILRAGKPVARSQNILSLSPEAQEVVSILSNEVQDYLADAPQLEEPEGSLGFANSGEAAVMLASANTPPIEVRTTVDEIASSNRGSPLRKLIVGLRTVARETLRRKGTDEELLCGNVSFYGIE